jgi:hypothetical protein
LIWRLLLAATFQSTAHSISLRYLQMSPTIASKGKEKEKQLVSLYLELAASILSGG